jgi:hypothetical protein
VLRQCFHLSVQFVAGRLLCLILLSCLAARPANAASFSAGVVVGTVEAFNLYEASGLAASRQNPGVLWIHNDSGFGGTVFALSTNGAYLGSYRVPSAFSGDYEDIAIGPGPVPGMDYIYLGDIGDNFSGRGSIRVHRFPEPAVYARQSGNPVSYFVAGAETLNLFYPDSEGPADAEVLMVDPVTGDLFIATKLETGTRIYRASRAQLDAGGSVELAFVRQLGFAEPSGGDISPDGSLVALRDEDAAGSWKRSAGQSIGDALGGRGSLVPVIGRPREPNGEALGFHGAGLGYYTISEGFNQPIYYFRRTDAGTPLAPVTLIASGEEWRYRDLGADEGMAWRQPVFEDAEWASGDAPLGYGQGDEATTVGYGSPSAKYRTTYFRKSFHVPATAPLRNALLRLCFNDGVAVYLNGVEVLRRNLGPGAGFNDAATASNSTLQNIWHAFAVNPALLLAGTNVIAVELHRFAANGPDLTFDLQLLLGAIDLDAANLSPDAARPSVSISSPADFTAVTNAILDVRGVAKDNVAVERVLWSVGAGEFGNAVGTVKWTAPVPLEVGTNLFRVIAYDSRTNSSTVALRTFVRLATSVLTVNVSGQGAVTPALDGALLLVGRNYQLTAKPAKGQLFAGWSGGVATNAARLSFVMQSNLVLQANFITNFFIGAKGAYRGLLLDSNAPSHEHSGLVTLTLTTGGKFSGSVLLGGTKVSLSGQFDYLGHATRTVLHRKTNQLQVTLDLDATAGAQTIAGVVSGEGWSAPLVARRTLPFPKTSPTPLAARYETVCSEDTNAPGPTGESLATTIVAASGTTTMTGTLADSTKLTFKGALAPNGQVPLYVPLFRNRGSLLGWLQFTNVTQKGFAGEAHWIKTAIPGDLSFPEGFTNRVLVSGGIPPPAPTLDRVDSAAINQLPAQLKLPLPGVPGASDAPGYIPPRLP